MNHRGHRIDALNAGPRGWVAYVDMHEIGVGISRQDAHDFARRWIDDAIWDQYMSRHGVKVQRQALHRPPPADGPTLRLVHDADRDARLAEGIGYGSWDD